MPTTIRMPQLGESVAEGTIGKWLKAPGDRIERDEPIAEVITDKVNAELPSPVAGVVAELLVEEGQTVPVGQELARITGVEEQAHVSAPAQFAPAELSVGNDDGTASSPELAPAPSAITRQAAIPPTEAPEEGSGRRFYTPVVLRMAAEHGLDLSLIEGSGAGGRVTKKDLERELERRHQEREERLQAHAAPHPEPTRLEQETAEPGQVPGDEVWVPLTPMRRAIAEHMLRSVNTAPHAWTMIEVDATNLVRLRAEAQPRWREREGFGLSALPFVIKAVVEGLKDHPELNAQWGGDKIIQKRRIHMGIAVAVPDGLLVPVIRDADQKSIAGLAYAVHEVVTRARNGKLTLRDVEGGTFTLNNPGALGSIMSQPIINQPQAAILTMESIQRRPVVRDDAIAIRDIMHMCLSFDHRVLDGAKALAFLQSVKRRIEGYAVETAIY